MSTWELYPLDGVDDELRVDVDDRLGNFHSILMGKRQITLGNLVMLLLWP